MKGFLAVVVAVAFVAADVSVSYWIARRAGIVAWVSEQFPGVPRAGRWRAGFRRAAIVCMCVVVVSIPIQAVLIMIAGIAAAVGVL